MQQLGASKCNFKVYLVPVGMLLRRSVPKRNPNNTINSSLVLQLGADEVFRVDIAVQSARHSARQLTMSEDEDINISAGEISHNTEGHGNMSFNASNVKVRGNIHHTTNFSFHVYPDAEDNGEPESRSHLGIPGLAAPLGMIPRTLRRVSRSISGLRSQAHSVSLSASPSDEAWCREIQHDGNTMASFKSRGQPISAVCFSEKGAQGRVYVQLKEHPLIITEFKSHKNDWTIAKPIQVPDAASPVTRLAAVCAAGGTEIHLFYITGENTIKEMAWNQEHGWNTGDMFGERSAKISAWSSLSALRSANCIKLFYQRNDIICELSYGLGDRMWSYKELSRADRGTPIASTSYGGPKSTIYLVYFQREGVSYEYRNEQDRRQIKRMGPEAFPPQCSSLSAVSWINSSEQENIRIYYVTDKGEVFESSRKQKLGWERTKFMIPEESLADGAQLTALQMGAGLKIRAYYVSYEPNSDRVTLNQIAFSRGITTPKVKPIWSSFA
ncbi:hypothetical protein V8F33_006265 [Rhypophila sp. PSN 637]